MKKPFWFFICLLLLFFPVHVVYSQDAEVSDIDKPDIIDKADAIDKPNIFSDIGYSLLGGTTSNLFLHLGTRFGAQTYANMTFEKIWINISGKDRWFWEDGDRFLVNQFGHPYQGSTYFAGARINGFNFYEAMVFVPLGSLAWEICLEPRPSLNDSLSTILGGIPLGEMLHRLFLEVDTSPSVGALVGGFFVSPISSYNKIYNRKAREFGGGNIYSLSVRTGAEKAFLFFLGHEEQADSWKYPGGNISLNVVYGDPFIQHSTKPYDHFELFFGLTTNIDSYNMTIISDGYLFSYTLAQTDKTFTSTGFSMHYDFFNATNDIIDNLGYGNIQFSSNAIGWALKHKYKFSEMSHLEAKASAAAILWGNSMYNSYEIHDYWVDLGNNQSTYGMGGNINLIFSLSHKKAGTIEVRGHGYYIAALPMAGHSLGNVFFLYSSVNYDIPLSQRVGIGAKGTFWGLFGLYDSAEYVDRRLVSSCLYIKFAW